MTEEKAVHKLKRTSKYSFSVTLLKEMIAKYGWKEKQKLNIIDKGHGKIEISDWRKR